MYKYLFHVTAAPSLYRVQFLRGVRMFQ